ncbi:MAG: cysteine--tRNA ligase [Armatimonadota bacterium]
MAIQIYNTLARQKQELVPREPGKVAMYVCGVTPYAPAHIGHARSAVVFDVVRRWVTFRGYEVAYVYNITDVEDRIIAASQRERTTWREVADRYTDSYLEELRQLAVIPPTFMPRASEHIPQIVSLIQALVDSGHAYPIDGDVAFSVPSFRGYGKLSHRDLDSQITGARVEEDTRKRDPRDFFLWKAEKPGEPSWESPWGPGRPGWHIECSAMSREYLGGGFDIHGGGSDLVFPHHENEIAQSEAAGTPFARIWMHNGMVQMVAAPGDRDKMSKSLGNVVDLRGALNRVGGAALRYYCIAAHYTSDIVFRETELEQAQSALERLRIGQQTLDRLLATETQAGGEDLAELAEARPRTEGDFEEAMDDDFSTPRALASLHGLVGVVNQVGARAGVRFGASEAGKQALSDTRETLGRLVGSLGLSLEQAPVERGLAADLIELLIKVRQRARQVGQYELADGIRSRLSELGILLEDRPPGTTWRRR